MAYPINCSASVVAEPILEPYLLGRPRWCFFRSDGNSNSEALTRNLERMWQCWPMDSRMGFNNPLFPNQESVTISKVVLWKAADSLESVSTAWSELGLEWNGLMVNFNLSASIVFSCGRSETPRVNKPNDLWQSWAGRLRQCCHHRSKCAKIYLTAEKKRKTLVKKERTKYQLTCS